LLKTGFTLLYSITQNNNDSVHLGLAFKIRYVGLQVCVQPFTQSECQEFQVYQVYQVYQVGDSWLCARIPSK